MCSKSLKNAVMSNPDVGFAELPPNTETVPVRKTSSASNNTPSDTKVRVLSSDARTALADANV